MYVSIPGKLSEFHLHAWLFSNQCRKVLMFVGVSWSLDLRVQHKVMAKVYFARMLFCSLKNALQYSLAKCSPKKVLFMKRAFNEESILTKNIGEHF